MVLNLGMIIYNGKISPMAIPFDNKLELFNEFMVALATIMMLTFTEQVDDH
jgi:hypothetical protein